MQEKEWGLNKPGAALSDRPVRILRYQIKKEEEGLTVREYLNKKVKLSNHQISSLKFRADGIVVNGRTRRVTCVLQEGDLLQIGLKEAGNSYLLPGEFKEPPEILYEDEDMLIVNKVRGMVCHPSPGHYADSLANQVAFYAQSKKEDWTIRLIGRLDSDTSGVLLFAKNSETAALLTKQREEGEMKKSYLALCKGVIEEEYGQVEIPISRDENRLGKMIPNPNGKSAKTFYQVLEREEESCLLDIKIEHGRTHQIRVHMAYAGHPLIGDPFYGDGIEGRDHTLLHAYTLSFVHPFSEKRIEIKAPIPKDMLTYIKGPFEGKR